MKCAPPLLEPQDLLESSYGALAGAVPARGRASAVCGPQIRKPAVIRSSPAHRCAADSLPPQPGRRVGRQREEDANRSPTGVPGYIVDLRMSLIVAARRSVPAGIALQNRRWPGLIGRATCRGEIVRGGFNERQAFRLPFWFRQRDWLSSETRCHERSRVSRDWASCRY